MSMGIALDAEEWQRFTLPHTVCLLGEQLYLLGAPAMSAAVNLRLEVVLSDSGEGLELRFGPAGAESEWDAALPTVEDLAEAWSRAVAEVGVEDPSVLDGKAISLSFDESLAACPPGLLVNSPAVGAALAVACLALSGRIERMEETDAARVGCRLLQEVRAAGESPDRFYGPVLTSLAGGVQYVEAGGTPLNVQQLLPPESLLLLLLPGGQEEAKGPHLDEQIRQHLVSARCHGQDVIRRGDAGLGALFELDEQVLDERGKSMLYGLLRVRQMTEGFVEMLGEPFVDNDRLAEICDEESAILQDYFDFPAAPLNRIRHRAVQAGALGAKLTWVFGGYPASLLLAPGRRGEVREALSGEFPDAQFIPLDVESLGLQWGTSEE